MYGGTVFKCLWLQYITINRKCSEGVVCSEGMNITRQQVSVQLNYPTGSVKNSRIANKIIL